MVVGTIDMPALKANATAKGFDIFRTGAERSYVEVGSNGTTSDHLDPALVSTGSTNLSYDSTTWTPQYRLYQGYLAATGGDRFYVIYRLLAQNSGCGCGAGGGVALGSLDGGGVGGVTITLPISM